MLMPNFNPIVTKFGKLKKLKLISYLHAFSHVNNLKCEEKIFFFSRQKRISTNNWLKKQLTKSG